ncbi:MULTISPECIES: KPN_02809 family neutral zinc metallopeptidase [unclassified Luteococcus]|uniref:KPN_02809 family neutral zinc metallopeptidase n=1 Tax=unclassified Luteococcus TaxID=2639923 RepID=UPI00313DE58A
MQFNENATLDSSQMQSAGGGGGGGVAIGGGLGLIIMILGLIFGFNPNDLLGGATQDAATQSGEQANQYAECKTGADIAKNRECRWVAYVNSIQGYWATQFQQGQYVKAPTVSFSGRVNTACGAATSQVGPFYCPGDRKVYIDTEFADQLLQQLGAQGGPAAEAYILAHEYGHHISNMTGDLAKSQSGGQQSGPDSMAVRTELQADCYAGVWFKNAATNDQTGIISGIQQDDLNRIVDAAAAVGDDRIQSSTTGQVNPESWTHGSAQMRQNWVGKGFTSGDPKVCSTAMTAQDLES